MISGCEKWVWKSMISSKADGFSCNICKKYTQFSDFSGIFQTQHLTVKSVRLCTLACAQCTNIKMTLISEDVTFRLWPFHYVLVYHLLLISLYLYMFILSWDGPVSSMHDTVSVWWPGHLCCCSTQVFAGCSMVMMDTGKYLINVFFFIQNHTMIFITFIDY